MYQGGCAGMIFRFHPKDLSANEDELPPIVAKDFIGVIVSGIREFFDNLKTGTSLSDPDHKSSFSLGHFSGTTFQSTRRTTVGAKAPSSNLTDSDLPRADFLPKRKTQGSGT